MRTIILISTLSLILTSCSISDWFTIQKEATEAIDNLTEEAVSIKDGLERKVGQFQQAGESVSNAIDAVQTAKDDLKAITGGDEVVNAEEAE